MQKPRLKDDVPQSSIEASSFSSRSNVSGRYGIVPDDRTAGRKKSEDSSSSADEFAHKKKQGDKHILQEKERIAARLSQVEGGCV